ncbi:MULTISPECIES: ADP-ribosylglycohydrolase family protein [unclassified Streptomyces]|uniref:ADP-ribosylglycohydrolase family protein n=1 Tax=unclassified Streptomyces TaxID=2593676 RepID=UPI000B2C5F2F|nr:MULTISPECIES: ADP-ribosylglycohydrolase family protein [unclassified Streptomyces]
MTTAHATAGGGAGTGAATPAGPHHTTAGGGTGTGATPHDTAPAGRAGTKAAPPAGPHHTTAGGGTGTAATRATAGGGEAVPSRRARIEGLLLGLAAGDAAGWPAARHRAARMPEWTRRLTRELDTFAEQNATTTLPVPIALNQPPEPLRLGPSDDAEWAAFAGRTVLAAAADEAYGLSPGRRTRDAVDRAWNALAATVAAASARAPEVEAAVLPLRARISVRAGLGNLAAGLRPPATGHDNPHYFDDAACVRAAVLAVVHPGDPEEAAALAEFDARYTQDGDGVHGARAMAAAVAVALAGADVDTVVNAALAQLPDATEIARNATHAVRLAREFADEPAGAFALVPVLEHQIVDHVYSYGIAAAETVPVALALTTAARGEITQALPAAACLSRVADSAPALAGALTGAIGSITAVPAGWREACRTLAGCALPRLAGLDLLELAGLLAATEPAAPGGQFRHDAHNGHGTRRLDPADLPRHARTR